MPPPSIASDPLQLAELIVTWSGFVLAGFGLLMTVLTIAFVGAGFFGVRELRSIRQVGQRARHELDQQKDVAGDIVLQANNAVRSAEALSAEANTLIGRVRAAVASVEEQAIRVHELDESLQDRLRDIDTRLSRQVEVSYLFNQAEAAYREGQYEKTVDLMRRAVDLDSKNFRVRYRLGRALTNLGEEGAAAQELRVALELGLATDAGERGLAQAYRYSQPDQAREHAQRAVDHRADNAHNWNCLGLIRRDNGDFAGAREAHRHANQLDAELVTTPFYLALLAAEAHAFPHATDRSGEAMRRLEDSERRGRIKPIWADLIRWTDHMLRGSYAGADRFAASIYQSCPSERRAREICDHMDFLLRSLGREEHHERYIGQIEQRWLRNHGSGPNGH
jgi:Flp pilus assembly protein TadD